MKSLFRYNNGIGLIEILITMGILAIGILGVASLNSVIGRQSQENKAQAEALAIAQSRIEDLRNYTNDVSTPAEFDAWYADTGGFVDSPTIEGTNAIFTRSENIETVDGNKIIDVNVSWTDSDGVSQNVFLNTELAYVSPRSVGDLATTATPETVNAPTGRARLGEGELPDEVNEDDLPQNGDGTAIYNDGGVDSKLVSDGQIVLTLALACQTDVNNCLEFVRIRGTVYIDTNSQSQLEPGEVFLVASDAAFCARYYPGTTDADGDGILDPVRVTPTTTTAETPETANGDYEYFKYTCYIGGGWHGNIGVILAGGLKLTDKVCVGDPTTEVGTSGEPVVAVRRAYRGMLYKIDEVTLGGDGNPSPPADTYYSAGIADGAQLPVPETTQAGHDFIIGDMAANKNSGPDCVSEGIMTRTDATVGGVQGAFFAGMPADFICLNDYNLIDPNYDPTIFDEEPGCHYDPTDPPSTRYEVTGSIKLTGLEYADNLTLAQGIKPYTSDGANNCEDPIFDSSNNGSAWAYNVDGYSANYTCYVYSWSDNTGWTGFVQLNYDEANMNCEPSRLPFSAVITNSAGNDFTTCTPGTFAVYRSSNDGQSGVTVGGNGNNGNKKLISAVISGGGTCTLASSGLGYTCKTPETTSPWNVTITFTAFGTGNQATKICPVDGKSISTEPLNVQVFQFNDVVGGIVSLPLKIVGNNGTGCI